MAYKSLKKIYYKKTEDVEVVYQARCQSEAAYHFDIWIKQYKHKTAYPAFLCLTQEMFLLMERIYKSYEVFLYLVNTVPHVILRQFSLLCIVDEVKSTNDIEGVRSTRREIKEILDGGYGNPTVWRVLSKSIGDCFQRKRSPLKQAMTSVSFMMNLHMKRSFVTIREMNWMEKYSARILLILLPRRNVLCTKGFFLKHEL